MKLIERLYAETAEIEVALVDYRHNDAYVTATLGKRRSGEWEAYYSIVPGPGESLHGIDFSTDLEMLNGITQAVSAAAKALERDSQYAIIQSIEEVASRIEISDTVADLKSGIKRLSEEIGHKIYVAYLT